MQLLTSDIGKCFCSVFYYFSFLIIVFISMSIFLLKNVFFYHCNILMSEIMFTYLLTLKNKLLIKVLNTAELPMG